MSAVSRRAPQSVEEISDDLLHSADKITVVSVKIVQPFARVPR